MTSLDHLPHRRPRVGGPRPQITAATARVTIVHRPAWTMDGQPMPEVSYVELDRLETYRVDGLRLRVYDRTALTLTPPERVLWLDAPIPAHLTSHAGIVAWLVAGLETEAEVAA